MSCNLIQIVQSVRKALSFGRQPTRDQLLYLLHFDGTPGTVGSAEEMGHTVYGAGTLTAAAAKFGPTSAQSREMSTNWDVADRFGTGDFTVEMWIHPTRLYTVNGLLCASNSYDNTTGMCAYVRENGAVCFASGNAVRAVTAAGLVAINRWTHIAFTREGRLVRIWVDGKLGATWTTASSTTMNITDFSFRLGYSYARENGTTTGTLSGYMDEVRVVKGLAVYYEEFEVPTAAFEVPPI